MERRDPWHKLRRYGFGHSWRLSCFGRHHQHHIQEELRRHNCCSSFCRLRTASSLLLLGNALEDEVSALPTTYLQISQWTRIHGTIHPGVHSHDVHSEPYLALSVRTLTTVLCRGSLLTCTRTSFWRHASHLLRPRLQALEVDSSHFMVRHVPMGRLYGACHSIQQRNDDCLHLPGADVLRLSTIRKYCVHAIRCPSIGSWNVW